MEISAIKETIMSRKMLDAERKLLVAYMNDGRHGATETQRNRLSDIESRLALIDSWLTLLSYDEEFVIRQHLIDGIDIPRIVVLYRERWGEEFAKTERTIKTYQKRALQKIQRFEMMKTQSLTEL